MNMNDNILIFYIIVVIIGLISLTTYRATSARTLPDYQYIQHKPRLRYNGWEIQTASLYTGNISLL